MSKDKTAPAVAGPRLHKPEHEVPNFDATFGDDVTGLTCMCNDDIESPEGRLRYQKALERSDLTSKEMFETHLAAKWFYVFRVESKSDEGEVTGAHYRIVFMSGLGVTYETHSDTAVQTLRNWIAINGWSAWGQPVVFKVEQKEGSGGRTYHRLRLISEPASPDSDA